MVRAIVFAFTLAPVRGDYAGELGVLTYSGRDAGRLEAPKVPITSDAGARLVADRIAAYEAAGGVNLPVSCGVTCFVRMDKGAYRITKARVTYNAETGNGPGMVRPIKPQVLSESAIDAIPELAEAVSNVLGAV